MWHYQVMGKINGMFILADTLHECDRQTDRQTFPPLCISSLDI